MVGPVEVDPVALLASFVAALLVPCTAIYLLIAYRTERRLDEVTVLGEAQLKALSDDLDRSAEEERPGREVLPRRPGSVEEQAPVGIDRPGFRPPARSPPREDRLRPGR